MDANRAMLEQVVEALGDVREDVVFLGGAVLGLLMTHPAAEPVRETLDVDCIVEVGTSRTSYAEIERRLFALGWQPGSATEPEDPVCRFRRGHLVVDVMPTDPNVLGFASRWAPSALQEAEPHVVGRHEIRVVRAPALAGMKIEAFEGRGGGDYLASHDLEDLVLLVDGRAELVDEVRGASRELRTYLSSALTAMWERLLSETLPGVLNADIDKMRVVEERLEGIVALGVGEQAQLPARPPRRD